MTSITDLLSGSATSVAPILLGMRVRTELAGQVTEVEVREVEAYEGASDPASHAFRGRTPRNAVMFGPPGGLYVYRSYGIHWCMNVVVGEEGLASAVLLRGGEPTEGEAIMARRRGRNDHLADGPGKLCQALGVDGSMNGTSILGGPVRLLPGRPLPAATTPRVGISKAVERPWRFVAVVDDVSVR